MSSWHAINSIADDAAGAEDVCLCYPKCNQTLYDQDISQVPYPGPAASTDSIITDEQVFGCDPTDSHLCYAKYAIICLILQSVNCRYGI